MLQQQKAPSIGGINPTTKFPRPPPKSPRHRVVDVAVTGCRDNREVGINPVTPISGLLDDFALRPLDATETSDFYELVVERHRKAFTIVTSNREPAEWLTMMSDALLAQSAVDRLTAGAHTLIIEGPSYRQRTRPSQRAGIDSQSEAQNAH